MPIPPLRPAVSIRYELGSHPSRIRLAAMKAIVVGLFFAAGMLASHRPTTHKHGRAEPTEPAIYDYKETRLAWWHDHRRCPTELAELNAYAGRPDTRDQWGTPMRVYCEPGIFRIESAGPDGRFGTTDDLVSDD